MGLPAVLLDMLDSGIMTDSDGNETPLHSNVSLEDAQRLHNLVRTRQPEITLALGMAQGTSTLAIAQALEDNGRGIHHAVDPFENSSYHGVGVSNVELAGLGDRVGLHEAFAEEVGPSLPRISFAFIDSSHIFDLTLMDFILVDKRLDIGGVVGFHDLWLRGLVKAVRYIITNRDYRAYHDVPRRPAPTKWRVSSAALARIPHAELIFRPELMEPSMELCLDRQMVFVEKLGEDTRQWTYFQSF